MTGLRPRLVLVALLGLLPLFVTALSSALPTTLVVAMAVLGLVLAGWAGEGLVLAPLRRQQQDRRLDGVGDQALENTEHALQLTRDRLRTAQRIGRIGNWDFDIASNRVWWSDETYDIYGLARGTATSPVGGYQGVLSHVFAEDREDYEAAQKLFFAGRGKLDIEHRIVRADGEVRWVHGLGESVVDAQGRPATLSGTVQDITERKLAEAALRASEVQFHLLTDAMPQIVCMMRADGWLTYFNQTWLEYTGLSMDQSLGRGWTQLIHPDDRARVAQRWEEASESGETYEIEYRLRRSDGSYRWMLGRAHPLSEAAGQATQWLGTFTDIHDLKDATEQLEKNMFMNRIAGRMARLGGWTIDLPERKLTWSDENCAIHEVPPGYVPTLDEGIGYFLPEDRPQVIRLVEACAAKGTPYEFILPKMTAKGRRIWVRSLGEAVRDTDGNIIRLQGAFQDITEQRAAETRTLALEARMMSTLESITDGFSLMDRNWRFTFLNSQAERMLQRPTGELLGKNLWEEFPDIAGTPVEQEYRAAVAEQRTTRFEAFYRPLQTWFVFHVYPTEAGTAVYFQDITQRREEQAQLRLLETAVSRLNDMVVITEARSDKDGGPRVVFVNDAFERQTGYSREEALGQSVMLLWGTTHQQTELHRIRAAIDRCHPVRTEMAIHTKNGNLLWLEIDIAPIAGESGKFTHWVAVERDITERRQQQQEILSLNSELEQRVLLRTGQLAEVNKELESFAYSVSHDLRSPLNTVDGFSQLLLKSDAGNVSAKGLHYLERIRAGVKQMGDLIEGLLTLAHLSREEIKSESVDLSAMARAIEQAYREREPQRQVQFQIDDGLRTHGDPRLLTAVLQNLLGNAWKFSARQEVARIEVGCKPAAGGEAVFYVRDNGVGFDMAFAHKLFGTFERLHSLGDFPGTGIGLATVKRVIERHGGRIWADSKPGEGATFYFTLGQAM
ncbi:MAG: PAS domain S-box protein [Polaromonas sp.]|uniref:PAS domain S-box protein n=1 Tax=Polaromonas sp. TaxID=1869339 RepID=UPI0027347258|nr:PAS domain S-box protein [Polaromonas sp.]MDP2818699.1 PAS domain S-box protein [Polaromonas sp.]